MALKDKLKQNIIKLDGGLSRTSEEELRSLSEAAGRPLPPVTPQEAAVVGGSPDQAKMAGTPAQRLSISPEQGLRDILRRQQARTGATAEEEQKLAGAKKLGLLSGLEGRVESLAEQYLQQATQAPVAAGLQVGGPVLEGMSEEQQAEVGDILSAIDSDPTNQALILQLHQKLGRDKASQVLTNTELSSYFKDVAQQVGQRAAEAVADSALVKDLDVTQLGFTDSAELADILGVTAEELEQMNVGQLVAQTQAQIAEEYDAVADLQRRIADPTLGAAERAEARKQLRDMGAIGIRAAETDVDKMAQQIVDADTVEFNGEAIRLDELLDDEYISGIAARYIGADDTDPWKQKFEEQEPELAKWLDENRNILQESISNLDEGLQRFSEIQFNNEQLAKAPGMADPLSDDLMKLIYPTWGELTTESYEPTPFISVMRDKPELGLAVQELYNTSPALAQDFMGNNPEALRRVANSGRLSQYVDYVKEYSTFTEPQVSDETWDATWDKIRKLRMLNMDPRVSLYSGGLKNATHIPLDRVTQDTVFITPQEQFEQNIRTIEREFAKPGVEEAMSYVKTYADGSFGVPTTFIAAAPISLEAASVMRGMDQFSPAQDPHGTKRQRLGASLLNQARTLGRSGSYEEALAYLDRLQKDAPWVSSERAGIDLNAAKRFLQAGNTKAFDLLMDAFIRMPKVANSKIAQFEKIGRGDLSGMVKAAASSTGPQEAPPPQIGVAAIY